MKYEINDFIGVFDDVFDKEYCDSLIRFFETCVDMNATVDRGDIGYEPMSADNNLYKMINEVYKNNPNLKKENTITTGGLRILGTFNKILWQCYEIYSKKYGIIRDLGRHQLNPDVKIQKTIPSEGYHVWHCEHGDIQSSTRVILVMLYLNDVEEGGETEFLYQSRRIEPKMGRLVFCPAFFTHTHRGNPPLKGNKYMMNGWLQFFHEF